MESQPLARKQSNMQRAYHHFPYWILPLFSGGIWFSTLWAMIIVWLAEDQPHYSSMSDNQHIAYISDIGANILKPLFITGCAITGVFFFLSLCALRRNQALIRRLERTFDILSILSAFLGAVSLILLSIFDTARHPSLHRLFLLLFMLGVVFSAIFTTVEYWRLGRTFTEHPIIKISYHFKQVIVIVEVALSIAFGVTMFRKVTNVAAVLEWLIAFVFTFYVLSFFFDLRPKARTKEQYAQETREYEEGETHRNLEGGMSDNF
jgi:hypothetical protein